MYTYAETSHGTPLLCSFNMPVHIFYERRLHILLYNVYNIFEVAQIQGSGTLLLFQWIRKKQVGLSEL